MDSLFRTSARGREPLAGSEDAGTHVHYTPSRQTGIGCRTSRRPGERQPLTFYEFLALRMGVTLADAKKLHREGKIS